MRAYLITLGLTVTVLLFPAAILSFYFEPIDGDLTRIGHYSERDFGWNSTQPIVQFDKSFDSDSNTDVMVLGDSFSARNIWQAVIESRTGKRIQTYMYHEVGCLDNWINYALDHSTASTLIIETVERKFLGRFRSLNSCAFKTPTPVPVSSFKTNETRNKESFDFHISHTYLSAINHLRMYFSDGPIKGRKVVNIPLKNNCALFSNRRADRLLYFKEDDEKKDWNDTDIALAISNIEKIQSKIKNRGKKFVFILIPDKSTVYHECIRSKPGTTWSSEKISKLIELSNINSVDLLDDFKSLSRNTYDLYLPNDTHLSTTGYIKMSDHIFPFLY